jgi:hypothetical protein
MCGAVPPLPQYESMAWCSVKGHGQFYLCITLPYFLSYVDLILSRVRLERGWILVCEGQVINDYRHTEKDWLTVI